MGNGLLTNLGHVLVLTYVPFLFGVALCRSLLSFIQRLMSHDSPRLFGCISADDVVILVHTSFVLAMSKDFLH